jgi:flagellin-like protein
MFGQRKGITPVIAIVLLLMVTVGAVGVVYTQFQSLVGDPTEQIDSQRRNQNTDITIVRGRSSDT